MVWWLLLGCAAVSIVTWARLGAERLANPYQMDYGEGGMLEKAREAASGEPLYPRTTEPPYVPLVYGPIYPALWGLIYPLAPLAFWPGRLIALLATAGVAACLLVVVWAKTGRWAPGVVAAGLFLALYPVRFWTALARVDQLALLLSVAGWGTFVYGRRLWWIGALLMVAALFVKQSMVAAPLSALVAAWLMGEGRRALKGLGLMAAVGVAGLVLTQVLTAGAFIRDALGGNANRWLIGLFLAHLKSFLVAAPAAWLGAALACWAALRDEEMRPVALYLIAAGLVTLSMGKIGATVNYYIEFSAVAALGVGFLIGKRPPLAGTRVSPAVCVGALAAMQMLVSPLWANPPGMLWHSQGSELAAAVAAEPGEVLSEWMGPVVRAGKTLWLEPFVTTQMAVDGRWDQRPIVGMIRHRKFGLIVMSAREPWGPPEGGYMWTREERAAVMQGYAPVGTANGFLLLRPRPSGAPGDRRRPAGRRAVGVGGGR